MKHLHGNQYDTRIGMMYDIQCLLLYVDLADYCNSEFKTNFLPSGRIIEITNKLRGKQVYGNINYPDKFYVKKRNNYLNKVVYELLSQYHFKDVNPCYATYGDKTREELIEIVEDIHNYVKDHDLFDTSFKSLMSHYSLKYICNANEVANNIISYYGGYVTDCTDGVKAYFETTGKTEIQLC